MARHALPFSREEYLGRLARTRAAMAAGGIDLLLVSVNGGAKRDHLGGVRRDRLAAAGLSP